jgi:hypothetical protein
MNLFSELMIKFLMTHFLLVHGALVHLKRKRTNLNWGCYILLYPILAEGDDLRKIQSVSGNAIHK